MSDLIPARFELEAKKATILEINRAQREHKLVIPSDYVYFLLCTDGLSFRKRFEISLDKVNPIVAIDDIVSLEWLVREWEYDQEIGSDAVYTDRFLKIASTYSQDRILIGYSKEVVNQIHLFDYGNSRTVKICDSLFVFLNEHLILMDE
jgi:hypothetical protein